MTHERHPTAAGRFYPAAAEECREMLDALFARVPPDIPAARGAIVPHAGWIYSGPTAALGIAAVAAWQPETVVLFGAVHVATRNPASLYDCGTWHTPAGALQIDEDVAAHLCGKAQIVVDRDVHTYEHSIEVQLPLMQRAMPGVHIVPILVQAGPWAEPVGRVAAQAAQTVQRRVAFIGSTDLTHYGPAFAFEPAGHGLQGAQWAKDVNDRRLIQLIERLDAQGVIADAAANRSACGAGAIAATIGAMQELGLHTYRELAHTTSAERELEHETRTIVHSVGYEAGVFL